MSTEELRAQIMASLEKLGPVLDLLVAMGSIAKRLPAGAMDGGGEDHKPAR
jgi:hypothetical protein